MAAYCTSVTCEFSRWTILPSCILGRGCRSFPLTLCSSAPASSTRKLLFSSSQQTGKERISWSQYCLCVLLRGTGTVPIPVREAILVFPGGDGWWLLRPGGEERSLGRGMCPLCRVYSATGDCWRSAGVYANPNYNHCSFHRLTFSFILSVFYLTNFS